MKIFNKEVPLDFVGEIKFLVPKLSESCKRPSEINTYMSRASAFNWYELFKEGRECVEDKARPGQPTTSTQEQHVNKIKIFAVGNRRLTARDFTGIVGISEEPVKIILEDHLGLRKVEPRLVSKSLNFSENSVTLKTVKQYFPTAGMS